jgi:hypothetical protein
MDEGKLIVPVKKKKRLVKADPNVGSSWYMVGMAVWSALFLIVMLFFETSFVLRSPNISASDRNKFISIILSFSIFLLFYFILIVFGLRRLVVFISQERRRQEAARGNVLLLADMQPDREGLLIPPSLRIAVCFDWKQYAFFAGVIYLIVYFILAWICFFFSFLFTDSVSSGLVQFYLELSLIGIIIVLIVGISLHSSLKREIVADEDGFFIDGLRGEKPIVLKWQDVRLFAINRLVLQQRDTPGTVFELSNEKTLRRLVWLRPNLNPFRLYLAAIPYIVLRPVASYEEYDRQMQLLMVIIAERTGLPLYDLRKRLVSGKQTLKEMD